MLSLVLWFPVVWAVLLASLPREKNGVVRNLALGGATGLLGLTGFLLTQFDPSQANLQLEENLTWISVLGISYRLGIDGISLPLVILNSLLIWIAVYSTPKGISRPQLYYALLFLLAGGVAGVFLAQNALLFFLFYEVELIPLYLLIAIWGGGRRGYAATKFLIFTALSGILLLGGCYGIVGLSENNLPLSFDFADLQARQFAPSLEALLLIIFLLAFGIKIPLVPFHTWLPDAHVEASTPISVLLAGVLLKLGTYGLLRFGVGLFPQAWHRFAPLLAIWAVVSVLYGCLVAITQKDMKKMVAFSSIGHMGYILLGLAAGTPLAIAGVTMQMVSHGLISALLFLLVGVIYHKLGTRDLDRLSGLFNPERGLPLIGSLSVLGAMASAGIPGMMGFVAEFLIFRGSFPVFPGQTVLCMVGSGLTAVYFLILLDKAFFGRLCQDNIPAVTWSDRLPSIVISTIVVFLGMQPQALLRWITATTQSWSIN
ncbi:MAG: NADH-quinone oxidoreductase subunit M [Pseudanabaenaceae cyanobacterium SKYGB_i_bin29]|nr:NADH-quinone oxidoreductase subunit M [Pseudanabaenaceae cyanobacterium SKYG29]MDW8420263.1 NADH-quinone oxidoreductase subunit M [Pseudanabaenaceae cyanobacterium SKYGB_i_bin29]